MATIQMVPFKTFADAQKRKLYLLPDPFLAVPKDARDMTQYRFRPSIPEKAEGLQDRLSLDVNSQLQALFVKKPGIATTEEIKQYSDQIAYSLFHFMPGSLMDLAARGIISPDCAVALSDLSQLKLFPNSDVSLQKYVPENDIVNVAQASFDLILGYGNADPTLSLKQRKQLTFKQKKEFLGRFFSRPYYEYIMRTYKVPPREAIHYMARSMFPHIEVEKYADRSEKLLKEYNKDGIDDGVRRTHVKHCILKYGDRAKDVLEAALKKARHLKEKEGYPVNIGLNFYLIGVIPSSNYGIRQKKLLIRLKAAGKIHLAEQRAAKQLARQQARKDRTEKAAIDPKPSKRKTTIAKEFIEPGSNEEMNERIEAFVAALRNSGSKFKDHVVLQKDEMPDLIKWLDYASKGKSSLFIREKSIPPKELAKDTADARSGMVMLFRPDVNWTIPGSSDGISYGFVYDEANNIFAVKRDRSQPFQAAAQSFNALAPKYLREPGKCLISGNFWVKEIDQKRSIYRIQMSPMNGAENAPSGKKKFELLNKLWLALKQLSYKYNDKITPLIKDDAEVKALIHGDTFFDEMTTVKALGAFHDKESSDPTPPSGKEVT